MTSSRTTVLLALAANVGVGVAKLMAGLAIGSGALLSEAAHSVGDCTTELLLMVSLGRSRRPADSTHPFGYGKERYFWSLLAAMAIFVSGALFSITQGVLTITRPTESRSHLWVGYLVIGVAALFEGSSLAVAARNLRSQARRRRVSVLTYILDPDDPTVDSVALEDSAALIGLTLAALGIGLHQLTGSAVWDGIASLLIGVLLVAVAITLASACERLLVGKQADAKLLEQIERHIESRPEVVDVVDVLSMVIGPGRVLLCTRVDFLNTLAAGDVEALCVGIGRELQEQFEDLAVVFIQPTSRADEQIRYEVRSRYGQLIAEDAGER